MSGLGIFGRMNLIIRGGINMKNSKAAYFLGFIVGAAIGSIMTYKTVESKIQNKADEEIETMRNYYKGKAGLQENKKDDSEFVDEGNSHENEKQRNKDTTRCKDILYSEEYVEKSLDKKPMCEPKIITADEFGEKENYNQVEIIYYEDGIFTNDDEEIENPESIIGIYCRKIFEENPDINTVYIRNDEFKTDYEIIRSFGEFYDND